MNTTRVCHLFLASSVRPVGATSFTAALSKLPMKIATIAILAGLLLCACGNPASLTQNAVDPATGWVSWSKETQAVYTGSTRIVSDPSVVADDSGFKMAYTAIGFDRAAPHAAISLATSDDSLTWTPLATGPNPAVGGSARRGEVLHGRTDEWDENLETPFLLKTNNGYLLYYSGYRDGVTPGEPGKGFPASLGVAVSHDGINFTRAQPEPVLSPTPGSFDADAIYSPDITTYEGGYLMVYAGHCYNNCPGTPGVRIMGATSPDGIHWTKISQPLLSPKAPPEWMRDGVAEPAILLGPDGDLYLFFTGVRGQEHVIGVARAATLEKAWDIGPDPIVSPGAGSFDETGDAAPSVLLENGRVRMWFVGTNRTGQYAIGYAEAPWPLHHSHARKKSTILAASALSVQVPEFGAASAK